jgi:hypothetical protein
MLALPTISTFGLLVALAGTLFDSPASFALTTSSGPRLAAHSSQLAVRDPRYGSQRGTSTHWSGYAVSGTNANQVIGTWTVPSVSCAAGENSWSSPWVGIDGDVSNTVEQVGTDSDCRKGTPLYYAWYEMYPKSAVILPLTVSPGDSVTGEVSYDASSGTFTLTFTDTTTPAQPPFQTTQQSKKAQLTSVEWILEGPANQSLSNFGTVTFTGASATISGQTEDAGSFPNAEAITMVTKKGINRAEPDALPLTDSSSFSVTWQHA